MGSLKIVNFVSNAQAANNDILAKTQSNPVFGSLAVIDMSGRY